MTLSKFANVLSNCGFSRLEVTIDNTKVLLVTKFLIEGTEVPLRHGLKTEFFLIKGINIEQGQVVVLNINNVFILGGVDDSTDQSTVLLKLLGLFDDVRETGEDKFVSVFQPTVDNSTKHLYDHFSCDDLTS